MSKIIRKVIQTANAPKPLAPYSQAIQIGNTVYLSGIVGMNKDTLKVVQGGIEPETHQALENLQQLLKAAGTHIGNVVKTTVLLNDINDFGKVNEIYREYFKDPLPARTAYQVGKLPAGARIEIEVVAVVGEVETVQ